jgi:hypothetical protein
MARSFKNRTMQVHYEVCQRLARDLTSELYVDGKPRLGSGVRVAYWKGRDGKPCFYGRQTPAYACWAAGADDRKTLGPPPHPVQYFGLRPLGSPQK